MDFLGGNKGWTVVDFGDGVSPCAVSVKTAVRSGERPQVLAVAEHPGSVDIEADAAALREWLRQLRRSLPVMVTLARSQYRLQVMSEPAVPQRELATSLRWALSAENDATLEDFAMAWMRIPTEDALPSRQRQVYTVTTAATWLTDRLAAWRQGGLRPKVVDIRETALRNLAGALERSGEGLALVSADGEGVSMVFTYQGSLILDRFIEHRQAEPGTSEDAPARVRLYERVAQQLARSADIVGRNFSFVPLSRVVVAAAPLWQGLADVLAAQVPLQVEPFDLGQVFDLADVPALANSPTLQSRCLVALGATLRSARTAE